MKPDVPNGLINPSNILLEQDSLHCVEGKIQSVTGK